MRNCSPNLNRIKRHYRHLSSMEFPAQRLQQSWCRRVALSLSAEEPRLRSRLKRKLVYPSSFKAHVPVNWLLLWHMCSLLMAYLPGGSKILSKSPRPHLQIWHNYPILSGAARAWPTRLSWQTGGLPGLIQMLLCPPLPQVLISHRA